MVRAQLILALALAACGHPPRAGHGVARAHPETAPTGLARARVHATGVLAYAAATAGDRVVSVELSERFALVVRAPGAAPRSIDLGPADYDAGDLAIDRTRDEAWVASTDGTVRGFELASGGELARYALGQRATAVAAGGGYVATGSADGVLCLRRRGDGALLQCVVAAAAPLSSIDLAGDALVTAAENGEVVVWSVPALAVRARPRVEGSANRARFAPDRSAIAIAISGAPPRRTPELAQRERSGTARDPAAGVALWIPGSPPRRCRAGDRAVAAVAWTAEGDHILAGGWDRRVRLIRATDCAIVADLGGWGGIVRDIELAPGATRAVVASWVSDLDGPAVVAIDLLYPAAPQD